jgi:hypothetical protein
MMHRPYFRELRLSLLVYIGLLGCSIALLSRTRAIPWRLALALLPVVGTLLMAWAVLRELRRLDELQRRIQLEALGFAFASTAILTFGWGFLETFLSVRRLPGFAIWPMMAGLWLVGRLLAQRRYR